ncbi:uncharacterized protein C8orf74 homolog [Protopterus annectens]|uniref:uncharacterized protein C8orf74 homolog n=1 Tax=Protopterus annectens TaxID=7888 RepID=UPI001CFA1219|nr:uncharacterized protein C8orf74 homolog [Protopterus annectens]
MAALTTADVREVAELRKEEGRHHLRKLLKWEAFDEERNLKQGIILDILYESLIFAHGKGFPWPAVAQVVKFSEQMLQEMKGKSVSEAIKILNNMFHQYDDSFMPGQQVILYDYFLSTFIRHYQLYQFVLSQERNLDQAIYHLEIFVPPQPLPLKDGIDIEVWRYQKQLAELTAAENQKQNDLLLLRDSAHLEIEQALQTLYHSLVIEEQHILDKQV